MQNQTLQPSTCPPEFIRWDIKATSIGWGLYIFFQSIYCLIHSTLTSTLPIDLQELLFWAVSEWGIWLIITPLTFNTLRRFETFPDKKFYPYLILFTSVLTASLLFRLGIDYYSGIHNILPDLLIHFPRYLAATTGVLLLWFLFIRSRSLDRSLSSTAIKRNVENNNNRSKNYSTNLLVNKGLDKCLIRIDHIRYISSAGNYAEICCNDNQIYLIRSTMKQLEKTLPPHSFLRIHRSHIININEIDSIKKRPPGNGTTVQLNSGKTLKISKKYKGKLQKYRL